MTAGLRSHWSHWRKKSRYREVSAVCLPLVMGMAATTVMEFTDRIFLSHYSVAAIAAVVPAGVTVFLLLCFLGGVSGYTAVFIAQYFGSGRPDKVGLVFWQGIFFTMVSGIFLVLVALFATEPLFKLVGHEPAVRILEEVYFRMLCLGGVLHVLIQSLSGFFTGRGKTRPVMLANLAGMAVNIPLDYGLINGVWGLPELGIFGAALATIAAWAVTAFFLVLPMLSRRMREEFSLFQTMVVDREISGRLLKYGVPASLQYSMDIFAFTFFILMVGRMGSEPLAATNIVISISSLAFMPALGFSMGISSMAGHALGSGRPEQARTAVWSGIHLLLIYTLLLAGLFIFWPQYPVDFFLQSSDDVTRYEEIGRIASRLLGMVAAYILLDVFYMLFAAVLKGAGDTRFLLLTIFSVSLVCMILPLYIGIHYLSMDIYAAWMCIVVFIGVLCLLISRRYRQGYWEKMLVIDRNEPVSCRKSKAA